MSPVTRSWPYFALNPETNLRFAALSKLWKYPIKVKLPAAFSRPIPETSSSDTASDKTVMFGSSMIPAAFICLKNATLLPPTTQFNTTLGLVALILLIADDHSMCPSGKKVSPRDLPPSRFNAMVESLIVVRGQM